MSEQDLTRRRGCMTTSQRHNVCRSGWYCFQNVTRGLFQLPSSSNSVWLQYVEKQTVTPAPSMQSLKSSSPPLQYLLKLVSRSLRCEWSSLIYLNLERTCGLTFNLFCGRSWWWSLTALFTDAHPHKCPSSFNVCIFKSYIQHCM